MSVHSTSSGNSHLGFECLWYQIPLLYMDTIGLFEMNSVSLGERTRACCSSSSNSGQRSHLDLLKSCRTYLSVCMQCSHVPDITG